MYQLDRMELADIGSPEKLAEAIIQQIIDQEGSVPCKVPIELIAKSLDITEIQPFPGNGFEGALITTSEKNIGAILYSARSDGPRKRFTIGHELGHFLMPLHQPTSEEGFYCTEADLSVSATENRAKKIEAEANRFSAHLLMPEKLFLSRMRRSKIPDLDVLLRVAKEFDVSKEAGARRYVDLHERPCAIVFSKDGVCRYPYRNDSFPYIPLNGGDRLPGGSICTESKLSEGITSDIEEVSADLWVDTSNSKSPKVLMEQTLSQREGYRMTLLSVDDECLFGDEDDRDVKGSWYDPQFSYKRKK